MRPPRAIRKRCPRHETCRDPSARKSPSHKSPSAKSTSPSAVSSPSRTPWLRRKSCPSRARNSAPTAVNNHSSGDRTHTDSSNSAGSAATNSG